MRSAVSSVRGTDRLRCNRGSAMTVALALVFLIFAITTLSLGRITSAYSNITMRHAQTSALFLAEAGIQKAAQRLVSDRSYSGEQGTQLPTGYFDVSVSPSGGRYVLTSSGYANSPFEKKRKMRVQATVKIDGGAFRIIEWRENP